jgi:hypothetical protein
LAAWKRLVQIAFTRLSGWSHSELKTFSDELQEFLAGTKSQFRAGIHLLNPAFEASLARL